MTFSEANREFKISHTSHKRHLIISDKNVVSHFNLYRKISSKIPLQLQVFSQLQSDFKLFQQIITVLYCFVGTCSSTTLSIAYCLPKSIVKISETKKDYSACRTDNKLSFLSRERGKKYILSMNSFFPCKFHVAKMHIICSFSDTNNCLF